MAGDGVRNTAARGPSGAAVQPASQVGRLLVLAGAGAVGLVAARAVNAVVVAVVFRRREVPPHVAVADPVLADLVAVLVAGRRPPPAVAAPTVAVAAAVAVVAPAAAVAIALTPAAIPVALALALAFLLTLFKFIGNADMQIMGT